MGLCAGYALRNVGKAAAVAVGSVFCVVQGLSYMGYVHVNWREAERDYHKLIDRDGDGKFTNNDARIAFSDLADVLKFNVPAGGGFMTGLTLGLGGGLRAAGGMAAVGGMSALALPAVMVTLAENRRVEARSPAALRHRPRTSSAEESSSFWGSIASIGNPPSSHNAKSGTDDLAEFRRSVYAASSVEDLDALEKSVSQTDVFRGPKQQAVRRRREQMNPKQKSSSWW